MSLLALLFLAQTAPPMVTADAPMPTAAQVRRGVRAPEPPVRVALYFSPLSIAALDIPIEVDVHVSNGVTLFGAAGIGIFGQLGGDLGVRWYVLGNPFEGFFIDAHASIFGMFNDPILMAGGGALIGHGWRKGHFVLSIGVGFTTFGSIRRGTLGIIPLGGGVNASDILVLPGLMEPPMDHAAIQPTVRFTLGPAF